MRRTEGGGEGKEGMGRSCRLWGPLGGLGLLPQTGGSSGAQQRRVGPDFGARGCPLVATVGRADSGGEGRTGDQDGGD